MRIGATFLAATVISHVAFAWLPFEAKQFNSKLGPFWGSASFYFVSLCLMLLSLAFSSSGRKHLKEVSELRKRSIPVLLWGQFFVCSIVMVLSYYYGLSLSPPASFQIWTRFDMFIAFVLAFTLMREKLSAASMMWTFVGFASWLAVLPWKEGSATGLWSAIIYVAFNGYLCVVTKRICDYVSEGTLYIVRTAAVMIMIVTFGVVVGSKPPSYITIEGRQWLACFLSALCLIGVIYFRFVALRRGPLWLYSACGVIQVGCLKLIGRAYGNDLSTWELMMGALMFVAAGFAIYYRAPEGKDVGEIADKKVAS